jgi:uncharacterized membrane protein YukC
MASFILVKLSDDDSFVIGEMHNENEDDVVLKYPIIITMKATANHSTNVTTSKLMPFSENNIVALKKHSIVGFSKPNERIIKYYLKFLNQYKDVLDNLLEEEILSLQDEYDPESYEEEALPSPAASSAKLH